MCKIINRITAGNPRRDSFDHISTGNLQNNTYKIPNTSNRRSIKTFNPIEERLRIRHEIREFGTHRGKTIESALHQTASETTNSISNGMQKITKAINVGRHIQ